MTLLDISTDAAGLALWVAIGTAVCAVLAEWWHSRRIRRVGRLAFGPLGQARVWTRCAPPARVLALTAMAWGLVTLFFIRPRTANYDQIPEGGYRHLIIAWDVSPSMQLDDGGFDMGKQNKRTRAQRGAKVLLSLFERIALDQVRISIVAFFTGAKPVVVDTHDLNVVKNILDDLPLDRAFDPGKTSVISGIEESVKLANGWEPGSSCFSNAAQELCACCATARLNLETISGCRGTVPMSTDSGTAAVLAWPDPAVRCDTS